MYIIHRVFFKEPGFVHALDMSLGCLARSFSTVSRRFPTCMASSKSTQRPNVGIGVVILRHVRELEQPEVLLIRRGKAPSKGLVSFPGGSQEIGETVIECAIREAMEETGARLKYRPEWLRDIIKEEQNRIPRAYLSLSCLDHPVPFTAVDVIAVKDQGDEVVDEDSISHHYCVVEVAATLEDPRQPIIAGDDADEAFWVSCDALDGKDMVPNLKRVVELALSSFTIPKQ